MRPAPSARLRFAAAIVGLFLVSTLVLAGLHSHAQSASEGNLCPACALARTPAVQATVHDLGARPLLRATPVDVEAAPAIVQRHESLTCPRGPPSAV
jgi:hypothetical protein